MNASYVRIQLPLAEALARFSEWIGLPELAPPLKVEANAAVTAACEGGEWRGVAVFVHEAAGWTVFEDFTGYLASISAARWAELAGSEELVFAGYNEAVPYGQLIAVSGGAVVREFLQDLQDRGADVNRGQLPWEAEGAVEDWADAAAFVDADELADLGVAEGLLWIFHRTKQGH